MKTNNSKFVFCSIVLAIFLPFLFWKQGVNAFSIIESIVLVATIVFAFVWQKNKDAKLLNHQFYIAEDVFINVQRTNTFAKAPFVFAYRTYENCTLEFSQNGTYTVSIYEKSEPANPSCDYSAVNFSQPGDKFYLLILQEENKDTILKCFNAKYYEVFAEDFAYKDGKYYPKA